MPSGEQEEPTERSPRLQSSSCEKIRLEGPVTRLLLELGYYKAEIYGYNDRIKDTGYYLKPVHYVYKRTTTGRIVFHYYGRYWLKKQGKRIVYIGQTKPPGLPNPPRSRWEGFTLIEVDGEYFMEPEQYRRFEDTLLKIGIKGRCAPSH